MCVCVCVCVCVIFFGLYLHHTVLICKKNRQTYPDHPHSKEQGYEVQMTREFIF